MWGDSESTLKIRRSIIVSTAGDPFRNIDVPVQSDLARSPTTTEIFLHISLQLCCICNCDVFLNKLFLRFKNKQSDNI